MLGHGTQENFVWAHCVGKMMQPTAVPDPSIDSGSGFSQKIEHDKVENDR